jgi:hypothetical protein
VGEELDLGENFVVFLGVLNLIMGTLSGSLKISILG